MTDTLREEIYSIISQHYGFTPKHFHDLPTNKIVEVIEKRIDKKIAYYNGLGEFRKNNVRIDELEQLKQEMVKS